MATLKDVAKELGISASTVSRALNGHPHIDESTRWRVRDAAKRLNYHPNVLARALRSSQTKTVGLVIPDILNQFYASGAAVLQSTLESQGYRLIVCISNDDVASDRECLTALMQYQVDGIVHVPCTPAGARAVRDANNSLPIVELNRCSQDGLFDAVIPDEREGAFRLTQYLIGLGHTQIGVVSGAIGLSTTRARMAGFYDALNSAGIEPDESPVLYGDYSRAWGMRAVHDLVTMPGRPTAVFAMGNQIVLGVLQGLSAAKMDVPADISLVGFGDPDWYSVWKPAITTYALPLQNMGLIAAQLLLARMSNPQSADAMPTVTRLSGHLMIRDSVGTVVTPESAHNVLRGV